MTMKFVGPVLRVVEPGLPFTAEGERTGGGWAVCNLSQRLGCLQGRRTRLHAREGVDLSSASNNNTSPAARRAFWLGRCPADHLRDPRDRRLLV